MCFHGSPRSWGLAPQVRPPSLLPGPQFPGQGRVPPTPSGLANTFPGQRSTARGEGGFRSVSAPQGGAMLGSPSRGRLAPPMGVPCWGHLAEGTWHLPWACHARVTQPRAPGTSHGRVMLGSPSRGHLAPPMGMPCWGHLAKSTWHLPWAPSEEWQAQPWLAKNRSREHS